ncbi:MAG: hydrogenase maturation nickel metallochaperone HypA [Propionibacteriaceae bacterium]|nr:hydrogenase maturation nickel metallochaperone HypA [Propionibacteriaceae bacterium]
MHELSLCQSILAIASKNSGGRRVRSVEIDVGHLRQVVPETLLSCWELTTPGTPLESSTLQIRHIPAVIQCGSCGQETTLEDSPILVCEFCGSQDVTIVSGEEFMVCALQVED